MGIVWILGAGFSKPLGGPLLPELLSERSAAMLRARFPKLQDHLLEREGKEVRKLVRAHGWEGVPPGQRAWSDAEEFIEFLDLAAERGEDSPQLRALREYAEDSGIDLERAKALAAAAKRFVAAECCFFSSLDVEYEKWTPYIKWARELNEIQDTVVTFNYDLVVEVAAARSQRVVDRALSEDSFTSKGVGLLKLHGSVDWRMKGDTIELAGTEHALTCPDSEIAIASPGPSKARVSGALRGLWDEACESIELADAVVFVGFRFPPSDANAREALLGALNKNRQPALRVHTVLGPRRDADTDRLEALLAHAVRSRPTRALVTVHPLFAEDFLGLVGRPTISPESA